MIQNYIVKLVIFTDIVCSTTYKYCVNFTYKQMTKKIDYEALKLKKMKTLINFNQPIKSDFPLNDAITPIPIR